jgi:hypothetical protein
MQAPCPNQCAKEDCDGSDFKTITINFDRAESNRVTAASALLCGTARLDLRDRISPRLVGPLQSRAVTSLGGVTRSSRER